MRAPILWRNRMNRHTKALHLWAIAAMLFFCILLYRCGSPDTETAKQISVFVSIAPQKYFAERIGAAHISVTVMAPPGASPHSYEPKPSQMVALSKGDIYLAIGVEFEHAWLERIARLNSSMTIVHLEQSVSKIEMPAFEQAIIEHEDDSEKGYKAHDHSHHHGHEGADPHIWLSPGCVLKMGKVTAASFAAAAPQYAREFEKNYAAFSDTIKALISDIEGLLKQSPQKTFMVFHPSWGYFARDFNLRQLPIEFEGKEPSLKELGILTRVARDNNIQAIFVQPQMSQKAAARIAQHIGAKLTTADPLAEDWADNLRTLAKAIAGND